VEVLEREYSIPKHEVIRERVIYVDGVNPLLYLAIAADEKKS